MRFGFTDEQEQFRASVRRFMHEHSSPSEVRRQMGSEAGYDPVIWQRLARDLGLAGIHIPEQYGGQGFGFAELGIALEEMGRALFCSPFFASSVLATQALLDGATEEYKHALLPGLAAGEQIATLAWMEGSKPGHAHEITLTATPVGDRYQLSGSKKFVLNGDTADLVLVVGFIRDSAEISLFAVDRSSTGLVCRKRETIDATRPLAQLIFENVPARLIGVPGYNIETLDRTLAHAAAALACEMVGGARALLEAAVDYSKLRMQFGRPIGSFQAIKHKCADLLLDIELANAAACYAMAAFDEADPEQLALASLAKASASEAYIHMAIESIQIHGGIGFTWDHDSQLWFKRAKSSEVFLGDSNSHRERYLQQVEGAV